jgi:cell division protein FtsI/penicillin-binding protein 2
MSIFFNLNVLLGFLIAVVFGSVGCAVFLAYYESQRYPMTERSKDIDRQIQKSVNRCAIKGGLFIGILWIWHQWMTST